MQFPGSSKLSEQKMLKRLADLEVQQADLLVHQSERMYRIYKIHADLTRPIVHLLTMIFDRLPVVRKRTYSV